MNQILSIIGFIRKKKVFFIVGFIVLFLFIGRTILFKKPSTEINYTVKKEALVDTVQVSGTFNKTASEKEKALAYVNYQNAISSLKTAEQNKQAADATMWTKQQTLLNAQNAVNYKNDNITNPTTKKDYTDLEKLSIDSALVQAQKDFRATEQKYKEGDVSVTAALAQVNLTKLDYDDTLLNEPVITVNINEIYAPKVSVGQKVEIVFDAMKETTLTGQVKSIDPIGIVAGGIVTYETKVTINEIPTSIKPNMTALIVIETLRKDGVITVPNSSVIFKDGMYFVQKVNGKKKDLIKIEIGTKGLIKTEIVKGLTEGDVIVANPTQNQ
jgi:hypothetical protein